MSETCISPYTVDLRIFARMVGHRKTLKSATIDSWVKRRRKVVESYVSSKFSKVATPAVGAGITGL